MSTNPVTLDPGSAVPLSPAPVQAAASALQGAVSYAAQQDPDHYAKLLRFQQLTGVPPAVSAENKGKATAAQVDQAIQQQLIQRTVSRPSRFFEWTGFGNPNTTEGRFAFQVPAGATQIGTGKEDGKQHYFDSTGRDLGLVK